MNLYEFAYTKPGDTEKPSIRLGMIQAEDKDEAQRLLKETHDYIDVHVLRHWRPTAEGHWPVGTGHIIFRDEKQPHA